ncbi:MAG TPA: hypothetical protein VNS31_12625 [Ramlibacter sp.]|jgi:hypothetical protein|nr:hypothetical protein [Ramlibacter sp.]
MKIVDFSLEQGNKYFGRVDGKRFLIGTRVPYKGLKGLRNLSGTVAQRYDPADFRAAHGFWADFLAPTAAAEGALFHTLNTYDRARFTFAFLQFAAHVPNGDFVRYVRALLKLPLAAEYFPDLELVNGRICRIKDPGAAPVPLESDQSTAGLMDYLNPSAAEVEDTEVIQAAKFVHWVQNDPEHRRVQIECGVANFRQALVSYARRYGLDGADDAVCLVVADIRHQGRANSAAIVVALASPKPLDALLQIGEPEYHARLLTLRGEIGKSVADGFLGTRKYSLAKKDFVPR